MNMYAEVIIIHKGREVDRAFHYALPDEWPGIPSGTRVLVPFGKGDTPYEGYITGFTDTIPFELNKLKKIIKPLDDFPSLDKRMLNLLDWMRKKYFATGSDCIKCIVPSAVKSRGVNPANLTPDKTWLVLNKEQENAYFYIQKKIESNNLKPTLIHGVTGSGKTEIYLRLISEMINRGKQVIVLVPEISLTPQMIEVFASRFGSLVSVTHSRLSAGMRYKEWNKARLGEISVMIGTRSALFAPFQSLGSFVRPAVRDQDKFLFWHFESLHIK